MNDDLLITSFGAVGDGKTDCTSAINYALKVGKAQKQDVRAPTPGVYAYSDVLNVDSIAFSGEGDGSVLYALNPQRAAIFLRGGEASVGRMRLSGAKPSARGSTRESCRVVAMNATTFAVAALLIDTCAGAGIRADQSAHGSIDGNRIVGTLADSIHITDGSSFIGIHGNQISASGDDGVAVVSYTDQPAPCHDIQAMGNVILGNKGGRCMSVVGGLSVTYEDNFMADNLLAAGMYFAQENSYKTYGVHGIVARRNTIRNCGTGAPSNHYAIMLFSDGAEANSDCSLIRNLIVNEVIGSIRVFGPSSNILVDQNVATTPMQLSSGVIKRPYVDGAVGYSGDPR